MKSKPKEIKYLMVISAILVLSMFYNPIFGNIAESSPRIENEGKEKKIKMSDNEINIISPENKTYYDPMSGYYPATYGFENDVDGNVPSDFVDESFSGCTATISPEVDGHKKVIDNYDPTTSGHASLRLYLPTPQTSGTIEFWIRCNDTYKPFNFYLLDDTEGQLTIFHFEQNQWYYPYSGWNVIPELGAAKDNYWHHVGIDFECTTGNYAGLPQYCFRFRVDDLISNVYPFAQNCSIFDHILYHTSISNVNYHVYLDALGFSWDPNYNLGDNHKEGLLLNYTTNKNLDWMGYSLDLAKNVTIIGNTTIPTPNYGQHTIQVFGTDSSENHYQSEVRYFTTNIQLPINIQSPENKSYSEGMSGYYPGTYSFDNGIKGEYYYGTYDFRDDIIGEVPIGWDPVNLEGGTVEVIESLGNHKKVIETRDTLDSNYTDLYCNFKTSHYYGTIEFWWRTDDATDWSCMAPTNGGNLFYIAIGSDSFLYVDGSNTWKNTGKIAQDNTWYHIKLVFEGTNGGYNGLSQYYWYLFIDGEKFGPYSYAETHAYASDIHFYTIGEHVDYSYFIDAVGFSWDDWSHSGNGYKIGLNSLPQDDVSGVYYGTYDFNNDTIGQVPSDWNDLTYGESSTTVISNFEGHKNVVQFYDAGAGTWAGINKEFAPSSAGTLEIWVYPDYVSTNGLFYLSLTSSDDLFFQFILYNNRFSFTQRDPYWYDYDLPGIQNDWHHIKVQYDTVSDITIVTYNEVSLGQFNSYHQTGALDKIQLTTDPSTKAPHTVYVDAIGFSWDNWSHNGLGYQVGRNLNPYDIEPLLKSGWDIEGNDGIDVSVDSEFNGHKNVLELYDKSTSGETFPLIRQQFDNDMVLEGSIELYFAVSDYSKPYYYILLADSSDFRDPIIDIAVLTDGTIQYYDRTADWIPFGNIVNNKWYHIRIDFNYLGDNATIFLDHKKVLESAHFRKAPNMNNGMRSLAFAVEQPYNDRSFYIDAVGYSWDSNYNMGDNSEEGLLLSYNSNKKLNLTSYSLDDTERIGIIGDITIPMPMQGQHSIQVFGWDYLGYFYESNKTYFSIGKEVDVDQYSLARQNINLTWLPDSNGFHQFYGFINFSLKNGHQIKDEASLYLDIPYYYNPYDDSILQIISSNGGMIELALPRSDEMNNISLELHLNETLLETIEHFEGITYVGNLTFSSTVFLNISSKAILSVEDLCTLYGNLYYIKQRGYIDFGMDAATYRDTPWIGSRVEIHIPNCTELRTSGINAYYDEFWTVNRIEYPYGDHTYELDLPYGFNHDNHVLYINDTNLDDNENFNKSLNPFTYVITFNKKPLEMSLYIQDPNGTLGNKVVQTNHEDYKNYSLYCKVYDPDPFTYATEVPYFMSSGEFSPSVTYNVDEQYTISANFSEIGVNIIEFSWNLDAGLFLLTSQLENILEPVYNTGSLLNISNFMFYEQPYFNITYESDEIYMGMNSELLFNISLISPDDQKIPQDILINATKAYWDSHDSDSFNISTFENILGKVYHNESGVMSSSKYLMNGKPSYTLLNDLTYPYGCLIISPEILEFDETTNFTRQQLEFETVFDLTDFLAENNLNPHKDLSLLTATFFGSSFIDSLQNLNGAIYDGTIEVYNSFLDKYELFLDNYLITDTLEYGNDNKLLNVDNLTDFQKTIDFNKEIWRYIDPQNRITFRMKSYFEGIISDPNTYLSIFDEPNAVLGALIDYVNLDIVWWKESPELTPSEQVTTQFSDSTYGYEPTAPGIYNVMFELNNTSSGYLYARQDVEITVKRRPVGITLNITSENYTTGKTVLNALLTDLRDNNSIVSNALVIFHSTYNGNNITLGSALVNSYNFATLEVTNLPFGEHLIWAETIINNGRYMPPYDDSHFEKDYYAHNISIFYPLFMNLSQSSLELISYAPEGYNAIVGQNLYIYPKLIDLCNNIEVFDELIDIYIEDVPIGTYPSGHAFLINFSKPGQLSVKVIFNETDILNNSSALSIFNVRRLSLSFTDISPQLSIYNPDQTINITVSAFDLTSHSFVENLTVCLYCNVTNDLLLSGITHTDGSYTFIYKIPINWSILQHVSFYAINSRYFDKYIEQRTSDLPIEIRPYNVSILININETNLYVDEDYEFNFRLWNLDTNESIDNEYISFFFSDDIFTTYNVLTSFNNTLVYRFSNIGIYSVEANHSETEMYMYCYNFTIFEIHKRPTHINIEITDKDLVPGNNFSITVDLIDSLSNKSISERNIIKNITVFENIYDNGTLIQKNPFNITIGYTNTFLWIPYRTADFEFIFAFDQRGFDYIYQNTSYSILLSVKKRQVEISSSINTTTFSAGDFIQIDSTFLDLNTTNLKPISNLTINYIIQEGENLIYFENFTTDENGSIKFIWQIPSDYFNRSIKIFIISANTNYYQWNGIQYEFLTTPLETIFNVTASPNKKSYVNRDIILNISLFSIKNDLIRENISYEIRCKENSYYIHGLIDLSDTTILNISFSHPGIYLFKFYYNGSLIYAPVETKITYYIVLFPCSLNLINYPEFVYSSQQSINLTYQLVDSVSQNYIFGSLVKLYYIDFDTSAKIYLNLAELTDIYGIVNFNINLPSDYNYTSIILYAEVSSTILNAGTSNTFELFISKTPTYIDINVTSDSIQFYLHDTLNITLELYDYFDNFLTEELLLVEIETPLENITITDYSNQAIKLNFTEFGLYKINIIYLGSEFYLPSSAQFYYAVSPDPTTLKFLVNIPEIFYFDEYLMLQAQLKNNLTGLPLEGEFVKFYIANETSNILIYNGTTDLNGIISYIWYPNVHFIDQNLTVYAVYDYVFYYQNSMTKKISTSLSRYDVEIQLIEFPEMLYPLTEENIVLNVSKLPFMENAEGCNIQIIIFLPNGSRVLIEEGLTNSEGLISFYWTPSRFIFDYNNIIFEICVIENEYYHGDLIKSIEIPTEKLQTFLTIIPNKYQTIPGEIITINFNLANIYGEPLIGHLINIEIRNTLFSSEFIIQIGYNDTYEFTIPDIGTFEIIGTYIGDDRNYPCYNNTFIYSSEKFEVNIDFSILEAFAREMTEGFLGKYWNYSIFDYLECITLIANLTLNNTNIPIEGMEVFFYYIQESNDPILLGSNLTNIEGIATYKWNISDYSAPNWWLSSAIYAKIEESEMFDASASDPSYITLRKIYTSVNLSTITPYFRINEPYRINISLFDENFHELLGFNLSIEIYDPDNMLVYSEIILTNESTHIYFTPTKLGDYEIRITFNGTKYYQGIQSSEKFSCIKKEKTSIKIIVPHDIVAGVLYDITIELTDSAGNLLVGELVKVSIMYHDNDTGRTEYYYTEVIMGLNNTFPGVFPDFDGFIIKAIYSGSRDYEGCRAFKFSSIKVLFTFNPFEIIFFLFTPCSVLLFRKKKPLGYGKKKNKGRIIGLAMVFVILVSLFANISLSFPTQVKNEGLIKNLNAKSNYNPQNGLIQQSNIMDDVVDYTFSKIENFDPEWIPNLENSSEPYDFVKQNSTIVPIEADTNVPYLQFSRIKNGDKLFGEVSIEVMAFDGETGIQKVLFELIQGIDIVNNGTFIYNQTIDKYLFNLNTLNYDDGKYYIDAKAYDNNNNIKEIYVEIEILNHPEYDYGDFKADYVIVELTDSVNIGFASIENGYYTIKIKNEKRIFQSLSGTIKANETKNIELSIDPLYFTPGNYLIEVSIYVLISNILQTQMQEINLQVVKESVKLEIDVEEGDEIYSNRYIHFKARLLENDWVMTDSGELIESEIKSPIPGQILTLEIADSDNIKVLETNITDKNGYVSFNYYVNISKGLHLFNVSYLGNNIYKPLESMKLIENQGIFTQIQVPYVSTPVQYNEFGSITAHLTNIEGENLSNQTLYFNISSTIENIYLGMAMSDSNGNAKIDFLCNYLPGDYDIIISYDGDSNQSKNIAVFTNRLKISKQDTAFYILLEGGEDIICPLKYDTDLTAELSVNETRVGIEGIPLIFELVVSTVEKYTLGNATTDFTGFATITFNPNSFNLTPGEYTLRVYCDNNSYYNGIYTESSITILEDIPIITIENVDTYFLEGFQIRATLMDSKLNPLVGKKLYFQINSSISNFWYNITDNKGIAIYNVPANNFTSYGTFKIKIWFDGDGYEEQVSKEVRNALNVLPRETFLYIQGENKEITGKSLDVNLYLTDNRGQPIGSQQIFLECYRERGSTNLLESNLSIITSITGNVSYSLENLLPDNYVLFAYYSPESDLNELNNGFIGTQANFKFQITRISADLMVQKINLAPIMRGDILEFTVISNSEEAKKSIIPVRLFVDGEGHDHIDVLKEIRTIDYGIGKFSYKIPLGPEYQAGNYTFTIEIQPGTLFEGNTSISIDLVERTSLSFEYLISNEKAQKQHYIGENESIKFTLLDEDGKPLPNKCCNELINLWVNYTITNGEALRGAEKINATNGICYILYIPKSFGYEKCSAIYSGSRFFAPAIQVKQVSILKRPIILALIDFSHNNQSRRELPYLAHRGESLIVEARVKDFLSGTFLENQKVIFGSNGKYLGDYYGITDANGYTNITIPLTKENGIIQAGYYKISIKIGVSEKFQTAETYSENLLRIFEIGHFSCHAGGVSTADLNNVMKSTIYFYDEDNQLNVNAEFYVRILRIRTNEVIYENIGRNGLVQIPAFDGGEYRIQITINDQDYAKSNDPYDIISKTNPIVIVAQMTLVTVIVSDPEIVRTIIPFISDLITEAYRLSMDKGAEWYTRISLLALSFLFGTISGGRNLAYSWSELFKLIVVILIANWLGLDRNISKLFKDLDNVNKITDKLNSGNWLIDILIFIDSVLSVSIFHLIRHKKDTDDKGKFKFSLSDLLIELGILFLWSLYHLTSDFLNSILPIISRFFEDVLESIWLVKQQWEDIFSKLGFTAAFIILLTLVVKKYIIDPIVNIIFPLSGTWFDFIIVGFREFYKFAISSVIIVGLLIIIGVEGAVIDLIIKFLVGTLVDSLVDVVLGMVFDLVIGILFNGF